MVWTVTTYLRLLNLSNLNSIIFGKGTDAPTIIGKALIFMVPRFSEPSSEALIFFSFFDLFRLHWQNYDRPFLQSNPNESFSLFGCQNTIFFYFYKTAIMVYMVEPNSFVQFPICYCSYSFMYSFQASLLHSHVLSLIIVFVHTSSCQWWMFIDAGYWVSTNV